MNHHLSPRRASLTAIARFARRRGAAVSEADESLGGDPSESDSGGWSANPVKKPDELEVC
jgi:hypothetical protein